MSKKKRLTIKYLIFVVVVTLVCVIPVRFKARADINGAESQVIGAACSTFYYDGEYYVADPAYVNQLINALDSQYDLTQSQANICVDYIYNNVGYAIEVGYLVKVEEKTTEPEGGADGTEPGDSTSGEETKPEGEGQGESSGSSAGQDYAMGEVVEIEKTDKTKEEAIKDATDFASTMGVIIKFDNGKEGITVTDKSGNVLISTREAVKNTGFRLNSILVFAVSLVLAVILMIAVAKKFKLLEDRNSYEETEQI